ncbi:hypothetical protein ACSBM8_00950 [Sphingomonas sp. ASY06-1R]|uniref:hypothetical protein n=1 Tax=Sphingomonas sp. ASY06-1R TaxID=3445771 RepID=UPI003FA2E2B3
MRIVLLIPFLIAAAPAGTGNLPTMTPFDPRSLPALMVDPAARGLSAKTVQAHRLNLPEGTHITKISHLGGPLEIKLSDGRCFIVFNDRYRSTRERIEQTECDPTSDKYPEKPAPPPRAGLRALNTSFAFTAWHDDRRHLSLITDDFKQQTRAYYTPLDIIWIFAFRYPDIDGADISIVARYRGRIFITLNEVSR